jgi:O-acetyl-ADP-ribose deacetylase (regulator of RNase III)
MHVMHANLNIYSQYNSKNKLEETLLEIFTCAEKKKLKHIYLPVLGAGNLQFPPSVFPRALNDAI